MAAVTGDYLDRSSVRNVLLSITNSLLLDKPDDPEAYILDTLLQSQAAPSPSSPRSTRLSSSGQDTMDAASDFLEAKRAGLRETVQSLVTAAAAACGSPVEFYSAPGGRGRSTPIRRGQGAAAGRGAGADTGPEDPSRNFLLVASSEVDAHSLSRPSASPPPSSAEAVALQAALAEGAATQGPCVAMVVQTSGGLEGILLARASPAAEPASAGLQARRSLTVLPALRLWGLILAERLENLYLRMELQAASAAVEGTTSSVKYMASLPEDFQSESAGVFAGVVPQKCIKGDIGLDQVHIWSHDRTSNEMVLNNTGHMDGARVSVLDSVVGEVVRCSGNGILAAETVFLDPCCTSKLDKERQRQAHSTICVPLVGADDSRSRDVLTVVQFASPAANGKCREIDHFDLVGAELLQTSVLADTLRLRSSLMDLYQDHRQRQGLKTLSASLGVATCVTEVACVIKEDMPRLLGCEVCTLFFFDEALSEIWTPPSESLPDGIRIALGEGLVGHVAQRALGGSHDTVGVMVANDPSKCPYWYGDVGNFVTRNIMTVPVWSGKKDPRLICLLQALNKQGDGDEQGDVHAFTACDAELLELSAKQLEEVMQRLLVDMMWTKAQMVSEDTSIENGQAPLFTCEYYGEKHPSNTVIQWVEHQSGAPMVWSKGEIHSHEATASMKWLGEDAIDITKWEIEYWSLSAEQEFALMVKTFKSFDVFPELSVPLVTLHNFFMGIKGSYRGDNPYHNFHHAVSTLHYAGKLARATGLCSHMGKVDIFALMVASLGHDCDHRGKNNPFEIAVRSELALRYNDSSPLENHHCARLFEVALSQEHGEQNIFRNLGQDVYSQVRRRIIAGILATDMKHHGAAVQLLNSFELQPEVNGQQSQFLIELLLHTADIANPMMPPAVASKWAQGLAREFVAQAAAEEQLGLPVTPFMVGLLEPVASAKSQLGFIDFVLVPLVTPMFHKFTGLSVPHHNLDANREAASSIVSGADSGAARRRSERRAHSRSTSERQGGASERLLPAIAPCGRPSRASSCHAARSSAPAA